MGVLSGRAEDDDGDGAAGALLVRGIALLVVCVHERPESLVATATASALFTHRNTVIPHRADGMT